LHLTRSLRCGRRGMLSLDRHVGRRIIFGVNDRSGPRRWGDASATSHSLHAFRVSRTLHCDR
jgi:hypothetical protein